MSGRIILMRHGRPLIEAPGLVSPAGLQRWIEAYDRAAVEQDNVPPAVQLLARSAGIIISSSATRALSSLQALGIEPAIVDAAFGEARLPSGRWPLPLLPAPAWALWFRTRWLLGLHGGVEPFHACRQRAAGAKSRLIALAERGNVLLMGHGLMNRLIARQLQADGWHGEPAGPRGYWRCAVFEQSPRRTV